MLDNKVLFIAALCNCYALNFFAFAALPPSSNFSAPTFLPLVGHPSPRLNNEQEERRSIKNAEVKSKRMLFIEWNLYKERNFF
jgi:hypothetical protein